MDVCVGREDLVESGKRSPHLLDVKVKNAEDKRITLGRQDRFKRIAGNVLRIQGQRL